MRTPLAFVVALTTSLVAQSATPPSPGFEVASIRRSADVAARIVSPSIEFLPGGVWRVRDTTIIGLIRFLYPYPAPWQIIGGPDWISREFYDLEARAGASASAEEMRGMARTLLADRLRLEVHNETRELPAVVLTLPAGRRLGPAFTTPAVDCAAFRTGGERPPDPTRQPFADRLPCAMVVMPTFERTLTVPGATMRLSAGDATMKEILPLLGSALGQPVVDQTGVTDRFDVELQFAPLSLTTATVDTGPALRTAIREQFGFNVDDARASVEVLVIDGVERPSDN